MDELSFKKSVNFSGCHGWISFKGLKLHDHFGVELFQVVGAHGTVLPTSIL